METAIGLGNLIGGFALGLVTARVAKGRLIIAAYTAFGVARVPRRASSRRCRSCSALLFGIGVANMAFVIPSQTLFQERTPPELMARVVSFRFAIVFGGMTIATAVGGPGRERDGRRAGDRAGGADLDRGGRRGLLRAGRARRVMSRLGPRRLTVGTLAAA